MGTDDHSYFLQRATEEQLAAERAACPAAALAHGELALRYALRTILPDPETCAEAVIGTAKTGTHRAAPVPPRRRRARG